MHDGLHALGWVYMYCYCNHIYSMVLQRGFVGAFSKSLLDSSGRINFSSFVDVLSHCSVGISSIEFSNHSLVASGPSTGSRSVFREGRVSIEGLLCWPILWDGQMSDDPACVHLSIAPCSHTPPDLSKGIPFGGSLRCCFF